MVSATFKIQRVMILLKTYVLADRLRPEGLSYSTLSHILLSRTARLSCVIVSLESIPLTPYMLTD
jgi:hypothetical protein